MRHFVLKAASALACAGLLAFSACKNVTDVGGGSGGTGGIGGSEPTGSTSTASTTSGTGGSGGSGELAKVDKVDILFMVDNSRSMADKQDALALALSDLVQSLVNPACIDSNGNQVPNQPASGLDPCPAGSARVYDAVNDIHIGVVSSSIGGHGSDSCPNQEGNTCAPNTNYTNNDHGHLLDREDACTGGAVPTYQNGGFLVWDPLGKSMPAGDSDPVAFANKFKDIVLGAGQIGCGYESQLEGWYRFLVDPEPYDTINVVDGKASPTGIDQTVLTQRAQFLRPDSLLAVVMLSDENDCSTKEFGQFYFAGQLKNGNNTPFHLPRPRAECATNPNDPCCKSCGQALGACPPDPTCFDANNNVKPLTDLEDPSNIRCFDQKRRFGIDFLNPTDRYIQALTSTVVPNRAGELVANPIFSDLNPNDNVTTIRDPGLVVLAGIVGVPWQDVARDKADLTKGYKGADELNLADGNGKTTWDVILGNPATYTPPLDPLMIESIGQRSGTNPVTGDPIATPATPLANPINGHDYTIPNKDDLQYACVFDLPTARDCQDPSNVSCDCKDPSNDSPLCEANLPSADKTLQVRAKAYPGIRQLSVIKGVQGAVSSVCPAQLANQNQADFGYRPAIRGLIERMQGRLKTSN